jgi:hypothetical protein
MVKRAYKTTSHKVIVSKTWMWIKHRNINGWLKIYQIGGGFGIVSSQPMFMKKAILRTLDALTQGRNATFLVHDYCSY